MTDELRILEAIALGERRIAEEVDLPFDRQLALARVQQRDRRVHGVEFDVRRLFAPESDGERQRLIRVVHLLESKGLLLCHRPWKRVTHVRLTPDGRAALRSANCGQL